MIIRDAAEADLPALVAIYNAAIPGRMATADARLLSDTGKLLATGRALVQHLSEPAPTA